ncbi:ORF18 ODV-E56 [Cydia pomonella granulovirus]|uniref:Occlusion-derived virus envelope protein E56 n=2 Tax=Cydia pomonella granulosis virus TaxID=28289 RepID=OE56_GVCPM|nr:ORF18 ODV-E56 [Cydia pomonella granulovirus]Q66209.1 RecName: Full=Occlusion-derived virus envelope protein E56; Short=ODV-E56; AltName: Full=ODVP-6E [Cydia pomonella granulosis virus (isolate Mexican)]AAB39099.1 ORF18 ODV-E56 [Cydia pomonella granulovirus]AIU36667.1 ORF18 odv-e56 [Cydia pomonella granulovirus]AIU36944.1 ORF18 odv-e56 [Cydia pomonella granulovirus]AIU37086.1 ORF18 odv-e56 [Cydia pomonella granulovirus]AIU37228.1 ORF18 odv-e56 [Cydia pomonella granulovirus]
MSFFRGLRRTNKVYNDPSGFITDHAQLIRNQTPAGFNLNNPTTMGLANGTYVPGYNINGAFISNTNVNTVLRNNDVVGMRQLFPDASNNQMNGLTNLRRADNIPDATLHGLQTRKNGVKTSHPETAVRDRVGVENALAQNPRLADYLRGAGYVTLFGVSVYLVINVADLVSSIVEALNRTGGSWYYRGNNGGDNFSNIDACVLRYRSCGMSLADIDEFVCELDPHDPNNVDPLLSFDEARNFCNGYSLAAEGSVCRGSDTNADPSTLQYLDISELEPNQTVQCVEPYDFGDLIGDLGLDWLLGENGFVTASSNSLTSVSNNFTTILLVIGGILLLTFIGFVIFKVVNRSSNNNTS